MNYLNLFECYQHVFNNKEKWSYYSEMTFDVFPFNNFDVSENFILNYFENGRKVNVFSFLEKLNLNLDKFRYNHMVSTYFLGILISDALFTKRQKGYKTDHDFRWMWFIVCLYHDIGYVFERDRKKFDDVKCYNDLINNKTINLKHHFYAKVEKSIYSQPLISNYFNYCLKEKNTLEHGIIGGLLLYDRLYKNFQYHKELSGSDYDNFIFKNLNWDTSHLDTFANLADIITAHNIWNILSTKAESKLYKDNNLHELIDHTLPAPKTKFEKLLYLLCICDTIEPLKQQKDIFSFDISKKLNCQVAKNEIVIYLLDDDTDYTKWIKSIKNLETWLSVVVKEGYKSITINIL